MKDIEGKNVFRVLQYQDTFWIWRSWSNEENDLKSSYKNYVAKFMMTYEKNVCIVQQLIYVSYDQDKSSKFIITGYQNWHAAKWC